MRFFLCCILCPVVCLGASLDDLIDDALTAAPEVSALEAEIAAARAGMIQAGYRPNPEVSGEVGLKSTDADNGYAVGVTFLQTFERGGKRKIRQALADLDIATAELLLDQFKRDLAVRIWNLAIEHAIATEDDRGARDLGERCRAMIELLQQRPAAGAPVLLELRLIEASLLEFQSAEYDAVARKNVALAELNALLNRPPENELDLKVSTELPAANESWNVLRDRLEGSIELRIQAAEMTRKSLEIDGARSQARTDFAAGPFVNVEDAGEQEVIGGIALSLTPSLWHRNQGNVTSAEARKRHAEAALAVTRRSLEVELARSVAETDAARKRIRGITGEDLRQLAGAADLADRQYRLGAIPVQLFLDLQREYLNVLQLRSEALRDGWDAALEIERLTAGAKGNLP